MDKAHSTRHEARPNVLHQQNRRLLVLLVTAAVGLFLAAVSLIVLR